MDLLVPKVPNVDPAVQLALEEALVRAVPLAPVLRIWQNETSVVLGRGQRLEREVNVAACAAAGVPVLRRASGGGTVFHDLGNLNVTMVVPGRAPGLTADLAELIAAVLRRAGLAPVTSERGVFAGQAKLSGLAAHLARGATLAHATLLVTTPASRVRAYLAPAPPDSHPLDSRRSPVLPLCELVPGVSVPAARDLVLTEAAERYGPLVPRTASAAEICCQERLLAQRYREGAWHTTGRTPKKSPEEAQWTTKPGLTCTA
jgi:lipoate-protein ligase A